MMMAPCLPVSGHFSDAAVVDSMPADHFIPANYHLLTRLCRHVVDARCAVDQGLSQGAAIRKQHHPAPLLFDASHPAIEDAEVVFQEKSSTKDCFSGAGI